MCFLNWWHRFKKQDKDYNKNLWKEEIEEGERIVRFILSPLHFNKKNKLRSNAFNPTPGTKDVSVSRLEVLPINQIKSIAKEVAANNPVGEYYGFALHTKRSAISCGAKDVFPEPTKENIAHAELRLGEIRENEDIHAETQEIRDKLVERCNLLKDPKPDEDDWRGEEPEYHNPSI